MRDRQLEDALAEELRRVLHLQHSGYTTISISPDGPSCVGFVLDTDRDTFLWFADETLGEAWERWKTHCQTASAKPDGNFACG